jgi:3-dehydrosphinganine reductase
VDTLRTMRVSPDQRVESSAADVSVEAQAKSAVDRATAALGRLDIVINNAGVSHPGYFQELGLDVFRRMMDVNYFGAVHVLQAAVPGMIQRRAGQIINISSGVAFLAVFGYSAYAGSKWALRGLSDVLRSELKQHNIRMSIAFPPDTDTPQLAGEEHLRPAETAIIASTNKTYPPDQVARDILNGAQRNRYIILTGLDTKFFYWLSQLLGPLQYNVMDMVVADAVKKKKKQQETSKPV